jgi:predicted HicB family RNase H-like nuclease
MYHDKDDGGFLGVVAGLYHHSISFEGETEQEIRKDFEESIDFYLDTTETPEKPFVGPIMLSMPPELHEELSRRACEAGEYLSDWIVEKLKALAEHH